MYTFGNAAKIAVDCEAGVTPEKSKIRDTARLAATRLLIPSSSRHQSAKSIDFIACFAFGCWAETPYGRRRISGRGIRVSLEIQLFLSSISAFLKVLRRAGCGRWIEAETAGYRRRSRMLSSGRRKFNLKNRAVQRNTFDGEFGLVGIGNPAGNGQA